MPRKTSPNSVKKALRKIAVTEKRLAANRANAVRSTGPKTPEGKARSAQNAIKHGFAGSTFAVARFEELHEIDDLKADAAAYYHPANSQEMQAVERIALAQMQMLRAMRLESGFFITAFDAATDSRGRPFTPMGLEMVNGNVPIMLTQNRNYALGQGLRRLHQESNLWNMILRYQAQAERQFRRAVEELQRLRSLPEQTSPNKATSVTQPEQKPQLATLDDLNIDPPEGYQYHPENYDPTFAAFTQSPSPDPPSPDPESPSILTPVS
jgi:hypothetical protein